MANHRDRPVGYQYFKILKDHLGSLDKIFNGKLIYPRQIEIHLPADHKKSCNFNCYYCQGRILKQPLVPWELDALDLIRELSGKIPYYIYGGAYSEPMLNPYMMTFLHVTKRYGANFGIHTNGSYLKILEKAQGWITELCRIATDKRDYLSISLDAGNVESHKKTKGLRKNWYDEIIQGIRMAIKIRGNKDYPAIRVCYLMNEFNSSLEEIKNIVELMRDIKVDSLRFSIPYDLYGKDFKIVKQYKERVEMKRKDSYQERLKPYLSLDLKEKPYIFFISPESQDVEKMCFKQCIYNYYQITIGADGNIYRCSSTATPSFPANCLGKFTGDVEEFQEMILRNHNKDWKPETCFKAGARCNRMALEINKEWEKINE
ncbi:hypothetical protein KAW50_02710 [candidate division WOR-3 bacterium]|nr:hypothetical protein [candidate division WOR-3 bacterium]